MRRMLIALSLAFTLGYLALKIYMLAHHWPYTRQVLVDVIFWGTLVAATALKAQFRGPKS